MKTSDSIDQLAVALAAAQAEMSIVPRLKENPFFKSKYADLAAIWEVIRVPLTKNGLAVVQGVENLEGGVAILSRLMHKSGQWYESILIMHPADTKPQSYGSAITYGRRYALAALVGVVSDEDDDGNAASAQRPTAKPKIETKTASPPPVAANPPAETKPQTTSDAKVLDTAKEVFRIACRDLAKAGGYDVQLSEDDYKRCWEDIQRARDMVQAPNVSGKDPNRYIMFAMFAKEKMHFIVDGATKGLLTTPTAPMGADIPFDPNTGESNG